MRTAVAETKTRSIIRVDEDESRTSLETVRVRSGELRLGSIDSRLLRLVVDYRRRRRRRQIFPGGSKPETVRRERGAAEVVAAGLLRLFEQKEYWSIKELANELKQPPVRCCQDLNEPHTASNTDRPCSLRSSIRQAAVKEQVAKYCVQNRKGGPNRQLYELRPDLKQAKATAADLGDE